MEYRHTMLHEFVTANSQALILRCREKMKERFGSSAFPAIADHGVPVFLQQLVDTLRLEDEHCGKVEAEPGNGPLTAEIGREAALYGAELLRIGHNIDQVVHCYGDVCQSITELAIEKRIPISTNDFRILNRSLDTAIAMAVTSFGSGRQALASDQAASLNQRVKYYTEAHRNLIDIAIQSYTAIKSGNIGMGGATSTLLGHALAELHALPDRVLPEFRQASADTTDTK